MRIAPSKNNGYGISKIGVHFSNYSLSNSTQQTSFKFIPTLLNSKGIISDTNKWFLFEEDFVATGIENFITIGWFADTITSDNGYFDSVLNKFDYSQVYYAIDSINLQEYKTDYNINDFAINIITPNNDGVNDIIDFSYYNLNNLKLEIFNRWGAKVFVSQDINLKWSGINNNNVPLNDGIYYYIIEAIPINTKEILKKAGYISLIH